MDRLPDPVLAASIWRAPLLPAALVASAGIVFDRWAGIPFVLLLWLAASALVAFGLIRSRDTGRLPFVYLCLAGALTAAAYHQYRCTPRNEEIDDLLLREPRPVHLRGILVDEPRRLPADKGRSSSWGGEPQPMSTAVLSITHLAQGEHWRASAGRVRLVVTGPARAGRDLLLAEVHQGDEVEVRGRLFGIEPAGNPGEFDLARYWEVHGVRARLTVTQGDAAIRRLRSGWLDSPWNCLASLRETGHAALQRHVAAEHQAVARALLLGEGAPMTREDWGKYVRTGVVHVLAISGQHLVVVATFLWWAFRLLGMRQRRAAGIVALLLCAYALLTGGRAPALRAAVAASAISVGWMIRRPTQPANSFALAWLVVILVNPADLFDQGCQLSFLAVALLTWGAGWALLPEEEDPLDRLVDDARPQWERLLRALGRVLRESYVVCLIVWAGITPLSAHHCHLIAPAALVLGPPLTLLTSLALLLGFLLFAFAWLAPVAQVLGAGLGWSLGWCEMLARWADAWSTHLYVGVVPVWWLVVFYLGLFAVLTQPSLRQHGRVALPAGLAWLGIGFLPTGAASSGELRCTFLSVGHGGCVVLHMPDGRIVLYDVGAIRGPEVTAHTIAPFLWSQGYRRIDDVILSHADQDHHNGLPELLERFAVGRVLVSTGFVERVVPAARDTLRAIERQGVALRTWAAGARLRGAGTTLEVLHPPRHWDLGNENARSLVLEVRHAGQVLLLTGDLEKEGLARLLQLPARQIDLLQAPHHGSHRLDVAGLARWCQPGLVVSCQGPPRGAARAEREYVAAGAAFWTTHEHGAITVRIGSWGMEARGYRGSGTWGRPPRR